MKLISVAVVVFIISTIVIGLWTYVKIKGQALNYYKAGTNMPVWVIGITLCAQAFDANGSIGNAALTYEQGFWAGATIPIGLAACLFITGLLFAKPLHKMHLMTLPDFYRRRYCNRTETLVVISLLASNIVLVAGNLAGLGLLLSMIFGVNYLIMLIVISSCILIYALTGGLYSTISTSVLQVSIFIIGIFSAFFWLTINFGFSTLMKDVPINFKDLSGLIISSNGAYINWATFFALALGDIVAIDFIQRVISADSPDAAQKGCYIGSFLTLVVGLMVSFVGLYSFYLNKAVSTDLLINIAVNDLPIIFGGLLILGVIAASMSTAAGVILDLANIVTRNLLQRRIKIGWNDKIILFFSRLVAIPTMAIAVIFAYFRPEPGILLKLAFDIVLSGCFVPLTLGIYWKRANAPAAIVSVIIGGVLRILLYYIVPTFYIGWDTIIPPIISLIAFVIVANLTQHTFKPMPEALNYIPTDEELIKGIY